MKISVGVPPRLSAIEAWTSLAARVLLLFLISVISAQVKADSQDQPSDSSTPSGVADNARLTAVDGSASQWSAQLRFTYTGSTLEHPLAANAVNPGKANPPPVVNLQSLIAGRYRLDAASSFGLRGAVVTETPLQKPQHTTYGDPSLDYSYSAVLGGFRHHFDANYEHFTSRVFVEQGFTDNFEAYDYMIYETAFRLTFGLDWIVDYNIFDVSKAVPRYQSRSGENDLDLSIVPALEYPLTTRVSFRTQTSIVFAHTRNHHYGTYNELPTTQLVGVTIGFGKAGYLNPYVSFAPYSGQSLSTKNSAVGLSATLNLF